MKTINTIDETILHFFDKNATIIFIVCDKEGTVIKTNRYTSNTLGSEIIGRKAKDLFVDFFSAFSLEEFTKNPDTMYLLNITTSSGLPQTFYFKFIKSNDHTIIFGESDFEELDNLRRNLIMLNNELNNLTRDLHKKNAELERLNNLKNQFLGMAAHDLRTPIGAIKNYTEFLLEEVTEKLEQEHAKFLVSIKSLSEFMLQLLNDLLDISAIESGNIKYEVAPISIVDIIRESIELTVLFANKKGIEINFIPQLSPIVMADPIRIKQVVDNLLTNAIKFSYLGTKVDIEIEETESSVIVSVIDEGPGIPEGQLNKLFKPFSKTSVKSSGGEKSTGLGLVIARKIIESHNGTIWAQNRATKGAIFSFSLPKA